MEDKVQLFYTEEVKKLIEDFSYCFDVKITFFSPDMYELLVGYHTRSSDFCTLMQNGLNARYRCIQQDNMMCAKCKEEGKSQLYSCHAGLTEMVIPITIEDKVVSYAFLGQFRSSDNLNEDLLAEWINAGLDGEELKKAFLDRPLYKGEMLEKLIHLFSQNLELLLVSKDLKLFHPSISEAVITYIDRHIKERIEIKDLATYLSMSDSGLTHALKRQLDLSFKELLIERRISAFEQIVMTDPEITIKEASQKVGYEDSLYFSRLYSQKRGCAPTAFASRWKEEYKKHLQKSKDVIFSLHG